MRAFILTLACLSGCVTVSVEKKPEEQPVTTESTPGLLQQAIGDQAEASVPPPVPPEIVLLREEAAAKAEAEEAPRPIPPKPAPKVVAPKPPPKVEPEPPPEAAPKKEEKGITWGEPVKIGADGQPIKK